MSRIIQTTLSVLLGLCVTLWADVASADIDVASCPVSPPTQIINITNNEAISPGPAHELEVVNATNDYQWSVDSGPTFFFDVGGACTGAVPIFTCAGGVQITIPTGVQPAATGNPVVISGTPTVEGFIQLELTVTHGVTECPQGYEIQITNPAVPFDLFFVLDRSGSMGAGDGDVAGDPMSRWQALVAHSSSLKAIATGLTGADGSQFGARLFATDLINWPVPYVALSDLDDITTDPQASYDTAIGGQSPAGATAMGEGLDAGRLALTTSTHNKVLVLFTDGEQNTGRMVTTNTGASQILIGPGNVVDFTDITVFTVGMGNPSIPYQTTLSEIANITEGMYVADDAIGPVFEDAVTAALEANSPQLVTRVEGGTASSLKVGPFPLNGGVQRLLLRYTFSRSFPQNGLGQLAAALRISRNGVDESARLNLHTVDFGENWAVVSVDFAAVRASSEGTFVVELVNPESAAPGSAEGSSSAHMLAAATRGLAYDVSVVADDHWFEVERDVVPSTVTVDSSFKPSVTLKWLGQPVENATVTALVLQPGDDLGDLLAKNGTTIDPSSEPDAGSPGYQKYLHLMENDADFVAALKASEHSVALVYQGNGVYGGSFSTTDISGVHQVLYTITAERPELGKVQRVFRQSVFVRPGPIDEAKSGLTGKLGDGSATLSFRPMTTNGRFLGPAQAGGFAIDTPAGVTVKQIIDRQDGSYDIVLEGATATTEIELTFLGQPVFKGTVEQFIDGGAPPPSGLCHKISSALGIPCWLFWVIVGVLVLLIVIVIIRRRNS
jgi:hypothetical protein